MSAEKLCIVALAGFLTFLTACVTVYNISKLAVKEALCQGNSVLEVQCAFVGERNQTACVALMGSRQ